MNDLELRLIELGDRLELDDVDLAARVVARLDEQAAPRRAATAWLVAAAIVLAVVGATLAVPSSRRAVADWFGLDRVEIERRPDLSVPDTGEVPGEIRVDDFDGSLDPQLLTKRLAAETTIERVEVGGRAGLWIAGEPHELEVRTADGTIVTRRFVGNTLLWQDGDVIRRIEGASSLDEAMAIATG